VKFSRVVRDYPWRCAHAKLTQNARKVELLMDTRCLVNGAKNPPPSTHSPRMRDPVLPIVCGASWSSSQGARGRGTGTPPVAERRTVRRTADATTQRGMRQRGQLLRVLSVVIITHESK